VIERRAIERRVVQRRISELEVTRRRVGADGRAEPRTAELLWDVRYHGVELPTSNIQRPMSHIRHPISPSDVIQH
jgi:hypothetical protein